MLAAPEAKVQTGPGIWRDGQTAKNLSLLYGTQHDKEDISNVAMHICSIRHWQ